MSRINRTLAASAVATAMIVAVGITCPNLVRAADVTAQLACPSCEDYDACTVDSCDGATGTCRHDPLNCDDGNACTTDTCTSYGDPSFVGCRHVPLPSATTCNDGNACTAGDACDGSGHCAGQPQASGSACDDGNACTAGDACDASGVCAGTPMPAGAECDDRNSCTLGERCVAEPDGSMSCQGPSRSCDDGLLCTTDSCDPITGDCVHTPVTCDDGNPCTVDACDPSTGACTRTTRTGSCDDRNICTVNDACVDGNCLGGGVGNCGWGNQCGMSTCIPTEQRCLQDNSPYRCPPPGDCGNHYECINGFCAFVQGTGPGACSDGNPCTAEMCVRGACTVQLFLNGTACNDGTACTTGDVCQNGQCKGTSLCSDGDACTDDLCDASTGTCLGHTPRNCDDGNPCTTDSCDPAVGCIHTFNSNPCDDQNACTANDQCSNGQCVGTLAVSCPDDGNPCTTNECDRTTGACVQVNNFASCSDGNPCTISDFCKDGSCHSGGLLSCDDSNVCTADSCSTATGSCVHVAVNGGPCSDGNACTANDTCVAGACQPGPALSCDDANPCTTDGCVSWAGCYHTPRTGPCDDGNPCTTGDSCVNGVCLPSAAVSCIDGNACTIDYCDRTTGACVHQASGGDCDDGDACTLDACDPANGTCLGHTPISCDDGNACTSDACDSATGCTHSFICSQDVVDLTLSFGSQLGKGSGTLRWRTTAEATLKGFNVVIQDQQGSSIQINPALIPCTECVTALGAAYSFIVPKHRSGHNIFVQTIGSGGQILGTFGPAEKIP